MLVDVPTGCHFTIYNIPFGLFSKKGEEKKRIGTALGNYAVDIAALIELGLLRISELNQERLLSLFSGNSLNQFMSSGRAVWKSVRSALIDVLKSDNENLKENFSQIFTEISQIQMHLPCEIGDYTDFYASKEHASNVGEMFRGKDNALMPNWLHLPVGYHGRASSIVVSGTPLKRPHGQMKPKDDPPVFGASKRLDFELEMAFIVGVGNELGTNIKIENAKDHIFGVVVMNDWSARDIQSWEYVPLGPFLGKNFGTTISPWIVTLDALEPFLVQGPEQSPKPLEYLQEPPHNTSYDVKLTVKINDSIVCESNLRNLYWSFAQQLAHHTVNGCNMRTGDLCGTGTISGATPESFGSMLELSWNATKAVKLSDGSERHFINDGDEVVMTGFCQNGEISLGFGECAGKILPA